MMSRDQQSLKSTTSLLSKMACERLYAKLARLNCPSPLSSVQVQAKYRVGSNCSNSGKELQVREEEVVRWQKGRVRRDRRRIFILKRVRKNQITFQANIIMFQLSLKYRNH